MNAAAIMDELKALGRDGYKQILLNHGCQEPIFGVKIEEMKKIQKQVKKDYQLALELYDTGVYDAMYLAGLIADDARMTKKDLQHWVANATSPGIAEYTVPWVTAGSNHGREMALKWIDSKNENVAAAGWATLSGLMALKDDTDLDLPELKRLVEHVQKTIHDQPNRVRYAMNGFLIAAGSYVKALTEPALQAAGKIGVVTVDMRGTACKVPSAADYIKKVQARGTIGKKRKTVKC